jgi:hypothetical protein
MSSTDAGIVGHLKSIIDACTECGEAKTHNVLHQQEIMLLMIERLVNGGVSVRVNGVRS